MGGWLSWSADGWCVNVISDWAPRDPKVQMEDRVVREELLRMLCQAAG